MSGKGPIYEVELIDSLPINSGPMRQAMPSEHDLSTIMGTAHTNRTVAGYEVLLNHWRQACQFLAEQVYLAGDMCGSELPEETRRAKEYLDSIKGI